MPAIRIFALLTAIMDIALTLLVAPYLSLSQLPPSRTFFPLPVLLGRVKATGKVSVVMLATMGTVPSSYVLALVKER
jgi:uncharacterized membrane protein